MVSDNLCKSVIEFSEALSVYVYLPSCQRADNPVFHIAVFMIAWAIKVSWRQICQESKITSEWFLKK